MPFVPSERGLQVEPNSRPSTDKQFPPPKYFGDPGSAGRCVQRAMHLMANSTPRRRNTVRVLFYGQSITEQNWWHQVAHDLRRRYPHANLIIENRATGGHPSQLLVRTAEADLYPFYPDLLIFHVYGSHVDYENIIRRVRERTTADILLQTDHVTRDEQLDEETDPVRLYPDGRIWDAFMNYRFLPEIARKYGCELALVRDLWKRYLREYGLNASQLLSDAVHLNDWGCYVMAQFVNAHLRYHPRVPRAEWGDRVKNFVVGRDVRWRSGKLALEFEGNRVDAICREGSAPAAPVYIDGRHPSQHPALYAVTRTTAYPGTNWPCVLRVGREKPCIAEEWTLRLAEVSSDGAVCRFSLSGSVTGADGEGISTQRFVSRTGRVVIEPEDWNIAYACRVFGLRVQPGFEIRWRVVPLFVDEFVTPGERDRSVETTVTLAQGLEGRRHLLEIRGDSRVPITALRVYCPPLLGKEV